MTSNTIFYVYQYWIKKRDTLQKPCIRKYWPQTQAGDTNPHHVFRFEIYEYASPFVLKIFNSLIRRARDKEKYRLRRQNRRNDLDSFR